MNVPDAVESAVAFDPLGELKSVTGLSGVCHDEVIAEHLLLIDVRLHLDDRTSRIRIRGNDGVALAGDAEGALHLDVSLAEELGESACWEAENGAGSPRDEKAVQVVLAVCCTTVRC